MLRDAFAAAGWTRTSGHDWDVFWSHRMHDLRVFAAVAGDQRLNHYPGIATLHYKDELHHFVALAARESGSTRGDGRYDFLTASFSMPHDLDRLRAAAEAAPETIWIQKPKRAANGEGIRLLHGVAEADIDDEWIVQEYVADPFLLPGHPYKHVLRVYVLVLSLDPLVVYVHESGVVKFTTKRYSTNDEALDNPVIHLTNPAIQRLNTDLDDPIRALDIATYRAQLADLGHDDTAMWTGVKDTVARTIAAHRDPVLQLSREWCPSPENCFELLGFDILLDSRLRPRLMEVNMSAALYPAGNDGSPHRAAHERGKQPVAVDVVALIGESLRWDGHGPDRIEAEDRCRGGFELVTPRPASTA